jgi:hypothetical protein
MLRKTILALVLGACGSKQPAPAVTNRTSPFQHAEERMPPELVKFHDVLAPHWHAEKGLQRMTDTCKAIGDFQQGAKAMAKAKLPAHANVERWLVGCIQLVFAVKTLDRECKLWALGEPMPDFDRTFAEVHDSFHRLLEVVGAMDEEHGRGT